MSAVTARHRGLVQRASAVFNDPAVSQGMVYANAQDGDVYAFAENCGSDGGSCSPAWAGQTGGQLVSSPSISHGHLYVTSSDGYLYGYAASGCGAQQCSEEWKFQSGGPIFSSPASAAGVIYFGSSDHKVYAVDETTHALLWSAATGGTIGLSSPTVVNGKVYIISSDQSLNVFGL
jgi:outer membrane protein assembly factor BamB